MATGAIVDYGSLTAYLVSAFERTNDAAFTGATDQFIKQAEDSFTPRLLNRRMEASTTLTTATDGTGSAALPADFYRYRSIYATINGVNTYLPIVTPTSAQGLFPITTGDQTQYVYIVNSTLYTLPETDGMTLTLDYYQKFVGLSATNPTNWIITNYSTLYQFSCMAQAALFLQDMNTAQAMDAKATEVLDAITDSLDVETNLNGEFVLDGFTP